MADLIIQDFVGLSSENLVRMLSDEKDKMFGIQKLHAEERGAGGSSAEDRKVRFRLQTNH